MMENENQGLKNASDLDRFHQKNKENQNLNRTPDVSKMSDNEFIDHQINLWKEGSAMISEIAKGNLMEWIVGTIRNLEKQIEELKNESN